MDVYLFNTVLAVASFFAIGVAVLLILPVTRSKLAVRSAWFGPRFAGVVALVATLGSLTYSEGYGFVPCELCWYQRIAMYPLVLVLGVGMLGGDTAVWRYALPLPLVGLAISIYHVTIQWQPSLDVGACTTGAPCSGRYVAVFGFISIPTMAGAAFILIAAILLVVRLLDRDAHGVDRAGS